MRTRNALERAKAMREWIAQIEGGGAVELDKSDLPFLKGIREDSEAILKTYPKSVAVRHKARKNTDRPHWQQRHDEITVPLLKEVNQYLKSITEGDNKHDTDNTIS